MNQENDAYRDEVSLVDLATIFVRRIWLFVGLFVVFVLSGVVFALVQEEQYGYVSLYQIAEKNSDEPVEKPAKSIAVIRSQKLMELEAAYKAEHEERIPFGVSFSNPENTTLIRVFSESERDRAAEVQAAHEELLVYLKERHDRQIAAIRQSVEARLKSVSQTLEALTQNPEAGQAMAEVMQKQIELAGELDSLSSGELMVVARESVERVAPNRKLIVVLATAVGFIFAFIAVFFAEFASLVRKALREQK
ncbi:hypothetical protein [Idiomarina abyssalis]|uniref:hypothetical protein n=1 Tax=Idiomarina abyssalis TaxID=86102 RepID=UPI001055471E|nr:hypothetical protein [Marinobacter sp. JH2]QBM16383.1 hypothetical protein MARI_04630 [Marinobacter sp. JH2]